MEFSELGLEESILRALTKMGFKEATPIQEKTIPLILQNRDVIALAQTGSGKTAACAIPICQKVNAALGKIQALIIVPTRELALQYATETQKIGDFKGVKTFAVYGGDDWAMQQAKLSDVVHVLVATPGRLIDLIHRRLVDLSQVATFILDEADEMLNMGFVEDIEFIFDCMVHEHDTLLFSATMPEDIRRIGKRRMRDPVEITLTREEGTPKSIEHLFLYCRHQERAAKLEWLIREQKPNQSIIFCESRIAAEQLQRELKRNVPGLDFIHGGLTQDLRSAITAKFRRGAIKHLVATDVAARGLDFSGVTHVFLYQVPKDVDTYVHRSGRTGRSGREGRVVSLVTDREFHLLRKVIERLGAEGPQWIGSAPAAYARPGSAVKPAAHGAKRGPRPGQGSGQASSRRPPRARPAKPGTPRKPPQE